MSPTQESLAGVLLEATEPSGPEWPAFDETFDFPRTSVAEFAASPTDQESESMSLRFGTYTEFQSEPHGDHRKIVWDHIEVGVQADQLGFDVFTCLEHPWFEQFAIMTDPLQLFALMSQRTRNIRFRALCHTLTLHNPMVLAGQIALSDILLDGRLEVGLGRGHAWLMEPANVVLDESVERYPEAVEILLNAWTEDRFTFDGKYYQAHDLQVVPKPIQKPHPPIWQVGTSAKWVERAVRNGWGVALGGPAPNIAFEEADPQVPRGLRGARGGLELRLHQGLPSRRGQRSRDRGGRAAAHELHPLQRRADRLARPHARGQAEADRRALRVLRRRRLPEHAQPLLPAAARPRTSSMRAARTRSPSS